MFSRTQKAMLSVGEQKVYQGLLTTVDKVFKSYSQRVAFLLCVVFGVRGDAALVLSCSHLNRA